MRILLTTQPAYGHFRPLLPVARALLARGHDVRVATSGLFGSVVVEHGLFAIPAGLEWLESDKSTIPDELRAPPDSTLETYFAHQFVRMTARRLAEDVIAHAGEWTPDVIVRESTEFGGALAAEAMGIPVATIQVASPSLIAPAVLAAVEPVLNGVRVGLGLPVDRHLARLQATPVLCFAPPALHDPTVPLAPNFSSFRLEPYREEPTLSSPLRELGTVRPLVYATLGTVFNNPAYELPFFPAVLEALGEEDVDVLVALGPGADPASLGPHPENVHVAAYVPQRAVLARKQRGHLSRRLWHGPRRRRRRGAPDRGAVRGGPAHQRRERGAPGNRPVDRRGSPDCGRASGRGARAAHGPGLAAQYHRASQRLARPPASRGGRGSR